MKLIITESQLNELERSWMDKDGEEIFEKTKTKIVKSIISKVAVYGENDKIIVLFADDERNKSLMHYNKLSKELFYDRSISNFYEQVLPHPIWLINGKYYIHDAFKVMFPDLIVKRVRSADIEIYN